MRISIRVRVFVCVVIRQAGSEKELMVYFFKYCAYQPFEIVRKIN